MRKISEDTKPLSLAWPIFVEVLLFMVMGNIDTLMLSRYSDLAVAAVGNANQILNTMLIFFNITAAATGIMVAQYLGAKKERDLNTIYSLAFFTNGLIAIAITAVLFSFQMQFFKWVQMPLELYPDTKAYLDTIVGFLFVPAIFTVASVILKSHGQTRISMFLAIGMNVLNVIGNYIFLFGPLGLPILGVKGVAISTVVSRSLALIFLLYALLKWYKVEISLKHLVPFPKALFKQFMKLGLPSAGEPMSWQFSQMVIFTFVNSLGTTIVTTRIYVQIIVWFTYLACLAIAQANQIIVGHLIGAGKEDQALKVTLKSLKQSVVITLSVSLLVAIFREKLLSIFTNDLEVIKIGAKVLLVDIFVELGRVFNLVIIFAMKAAGDVHFPVMIGIVSMWLVSTLGAYILGLSLGYGLVGIWIAMALDELLRGGLMYKRLKNGKWRNKKTIV